MANQRSNFPLRLQQMLSGGSRPVSPSLKLESEPPPKVQAFIDRVINSPLNDIADLLSGFHWEYNKGNFHHWRPLFLHFDTYFKTYITGRKDLNLSDNIVELEPFPKHVVLQILRVMQIILENCHNKSSFSGLEHFKLLLTSTDPEILIATLETLSALVKINPSKLHVSGKLIGCDSINNYLLSLAQGWGSKEEGLGLYSCVVANERNQREGLSLFPSVLENEVDDTQYRLGSTLHFEFNSSGQAIEKSNNIIHIPDIHLQKDDDLVILKQCVEQFKVPNEHRFSLLTRIRYARAFRSPHTCRHYSRICILAFIVLVQSGDAHDELVSFFANEPEYTNELIRLVRSEEPIPASLRALAMLGLGAQLAAYASSPERARILSGSSIISGGGNRMVLLSVLQKAVLSLNSSSDPSSILFVDALLQFFLLHVLSSSTSGSSIRGSGMVPPLLPLLQDNEPSHIHLVCSAVKTLQKLMEFSSPSVSLFKDLGGVELLVQRLKLEVHRVIGGVDDNIDLTISFDSKKCEEDHLYSQKQLIRTLLKALGSATYSPANNARTQTSNDNSLPSTLSLIIKNAIRFGGDIYFSAVTVMSEMIHRDPTCYPVLDQSGLPDAFLNSVRVGILPSSKALICIPSGLGAICLNNKGLEAVKETDALKFLVETFTSRKYLKAMNDGVLPLANAIEELLRHVSSLRTTGVDKIIEIIDKLSSVGDDKHETLGNEDNTAMETDNEEKASQGHDLVSAMDASANGISNEQFVQLCVYHAMVLVQRTMENTETCKLFVEKGGIDGLLKLLLRPSITQSSDGMPIALHSTIVFKGFTQHHSSHLARAFCSCLKDHLDKALSGFGTSGSLLLGSSAEPDSGTTSSLFIIEFLLFLAASKDNRWLNALLTEFSDSSKIVLENIGRVHREVLWQISLLEDSKLDTLDSESSIVTDETQRSDNESDGQRYISFRQYLDPLLRRRGIGWSIESQVSDLISIYRDLGRAASGPQRIGSDSFLTSRFSSSSSQPHASSSSDSNATTVNTDTDKQKSYNSNCRDMMRSLSYHITHLFMELGKSMLFLSRRENNSPLPSSVTTICTTFSSILLDHLNFKGHSNSSQSEVSMFAKCRYLGKVVGFIDSVLLDRPDSCNAILLNSFYSFGVFQSVFATFEATSLLLFAVNVPASPMETDDISLKQENEITDTSWIFGPLSSYTTLLDHLATSSIILSTTSRQLLEQTFPNAVVPLPRDAETLVKALQSKVLKAVLPIWTHPHFVDCKLEFIISMISIIRHVYSGVEMRNVNGNVGATRIVGPPPDESAITMIVEMGFPRARAEEALRQVGANSVERATDWLFSHPEEPQEEEDELARALAMSLGNSTPTKDEEVPNTENSVQEEAVELPQVDEILAACIKLLRVKESLAFSVRDLLVMIGSQNDGTHRTKVLTFIIDSIKGCCATSDPDNAILSSLFHILALILHEDTSAREIVSKAGLLNISLDMLSKWDKSFVPDGEKSQVPKWVIACFLSVDQQLQVDPKISPEIAELGKLKEDTNTQSSVLIGENDNSQKNESPKLGASSDIIDMADQIRLLEISCRCIKNQLPSDVMHAVLKLCATLTKVHSIAVNFHDSGGLRALLSLPTTSLFSGFNNVAATIIRHILEDPRTLQQAMELEIHHCLITAANRHGNGRVTPRTFVQSLSSVISREPSIFMQAARAVCEIEMVGDRPYVVLIKDREKERSKDKDSKPAEKDKQSSPMKGNEQSKAVDSNVKSGKSPRKSPQSFTSVIELLLDMVATYDPPSDVSEVSEDAAAALVGMEIDSNTTAASGKGKGVAGSANESKTNSQDISASLAKSVFIMKLLTEILLTYSSSIYVLLRRDSEISSFRGSSLMALPTDRTGGIFQHILHNFLPYSGTYKKDKKSLESDWRHKLSTRANQFLVAASIRSAEARKRIFSEINHTLQEFINTANGYKVPDITLHAFIDLLNDVLASRTATGSYISAEASVTFVDVGLVKSLTRTLQGFDLDNSVSSKVVTGIIKALDLVTKEHVQSADRNSAKGGSKPKPNSEQHNQVDNGQSRIQSLDATSQPDHIESETGHMESFNMEQDSTSSDSADEMDHDHDLGEGFAHDGDDDFMHEMSEDGGGMGNGLSATVEITFDIQPNAREEPGDDDEDEDMSEDGGDEDGEDEDENDDLEEDEVHHMLHPDTDQDEHEIDEEFDEDILEEDEDEDDDDDGVILRLEEGISRNMFDHIEVFTGGNNMSTETMRVMPVDIFGSRRQGRGTVYNLLGQTGEHGGHNEHPLLEEPSTFRNLVHQRQTENIVDVAFSDRHHENNSARLDAMFRRLRTGRSGQRLNTWLDDTHQRGGSSSAAVPPGIEELIISQLRRPTATPGQSSGQDAATVAPPQDNSNQVQTTETQLSGEPPNEGNANIVTTTPVAMVEVASSDMHQENDTRNTSEQCIGLQDERRDVEAASQGSSGSGATLGESLRSLDVEIDSVDGQNDDEPTNRTRRSAGNTIPASTRDASLESVLEVPSSSNQDGNHDDHIVENQQNISSNSDSIDPAFLEALPEDLRSEVISQQNQQPAEPSAEQPQTNEDDLGVDPEFLAALPPELREEVLANHRAERRQNRQQELEGQPVEMDAVSMIASFPSEIREEVLLTSPDAVLATLPPALVAEATMLRERFAHRYHSSSIFGMQSRSRRGDSSRRGTIGSLDRNAADGASRRSATGKVIEADGAPLVGIDDLKALFRILRIVQPLYKGQYLKLLLNLSAHNETRMSTVKILMAMLMLDLGSPVSSTQGGSESPYRLYGCQSHIIYSRPQFSNGVPPLLSRRILETLTYLARNHPYVAKLLLDFELPLPASCGSSSSDNGRGKSILVEEDKPEDRKHEYIIVLLLSLLNQPLYMRSIAHLEQLLNLLEVIMVNAVSDSGLSTENVASLASSEQPSDPEATSQDNNMNVDSAGTSDGVHDKLSKDEDKSGTSTSLNNESNIRSILLGLPHRELRLLCSLLAREGLSDNTYVLVAEVLKKLVAVAPTYCHLFITELANSVRNLMVSARHELQLYEDAEKALLTSSSTNGTSILRVLQALSSLVSTLHEKKDPQLLPEKDYTDALSLVSEINASLETLWVELSNSISKIENSSNSMSDLPATSEDPSSTAMPPLPAGTQNILPYIESFFVTCEKLCPEPSESPQEHGTASTSDTVIKVDEKNAAFIKFSEKHRKLLNAFIRQNPGLIEKSFSLMLKVPRIIDFDNKRAHFRSKIKHQHDHHHSPVRISVRRSYILEDSYNQLRMRSPEELKGRLTVHFQGEEGIDAGGLTREWYQMLSRVIFDKGALLFTTVGNESTFQPNPNSVYQTEHLSYFKFVGRVVGKALFDGQLLDVHFTRSFYKHILGVKVTYHDIEAIDPDYYKNLKWMLENDISDVLDLTFSMDADEEKLILYERAEVTDCELIPGGRNIRVTEENKHEYVDRVVEHRLTTAIRPQINAFMEGFNELISRDLISIFNDKELELLISGLPDIDLDDLRANTEYSGYSNASPVIQWFWEVIQGFSKEDKARFLQFVTGTSKVPLEGFSALQGISGSQRFQIHKAYGTSDHLPSAHTCFNQLDLPEYTSKERLQERLLLAIHEANEGFGFG